MKKIILFLCLFAGFQTAEAYESIMQWMVFRSNYSFLENKVDMSKNLGSDGVNAMAEDGNGNIYMAVNGGGLRMFDGKKLSTPRLPKESFANQEILCLAVDSKNTLWIGTAEGLVKFDGTQWTNIAPEETALKAVTSIAITATDKLYIAGFEGDNKGFYAGGLSFYNGSGWQHFNKSNTAMPDDTLRDLTIDQNGYLWMTVGRNNLGIARFDGKNWKHYHTGNTEQLPTNNVRGIATNKTGKLWFATTKGLVEWNGAEFSLKPYANSFGAKFNEYMNGDGTLDANGITVEEDGTIWLATRNKGVIYIHDKLLRNYETSNSLVNSNSIMQVLVDKQHRKWFSTGTINNDWHYYYPKQHSTNYLYSTGGITVLKENNYLDEKNWTFITAGNTELKLGNTFSINEDKSGNIWIPTTGDGLIKMKDGAWTVIKPQGLMASLTKAYIAPDEKIYLATTMNGVKLFENNTISDFVKWPNMGGVNDMTYDKNNIFWVSGTGGVSRWVNNDWETFNKKNGDLPTVIFYCLLNDSKGNLWAGSAKGLMKYDGTTWQVISKKETPFPSDDITALAEDKQGKLWVGSKSGISVFDGTNWTHISKVETPKLSKFQVNAISFDAKGNTWLATDNDGLLKFDGTGWTQFSKKNTGSIFDKITGVKAASDGRIYAYSEYYTFNDTDFIMPSQSPDYAILVDLNKRIKDADPKQVIAIISNQ
ncbi:MAG TPA: two-component regulator propeller domain-containing protein [Flavipsychrobacter sp.]|nr:two-component regulator propeller domain-containing protein [Flavipsychrobacter sp.]